MQVRYDNAGEVLRLGLHMHEKNDQGDHAKIESLIAAVLAGEESGVAEGDVMCKVRERIRNRGGV